MQNPKLVRIVVIVIAAIVVLLIFSNSIFYTIDPGEKAVVFKRFGGGLEKDDIKAQGFHVIAPWNKMIIYDVRQQEASETMDVLSSNGLNISLDMTLWYNPSPAKIGYLHDFIGKEYVNRIVIPGIRSATRNVIGRYTPEEIYSTKRDKIEIEIQEETRKKLEPIFVNVNDVLIRSVKLPTKIQAAIETKLEQEQSSLEYEFKLQVAKKEADRKKIEAEGIKKYQMIVTESLTDRLLTWQGIEATKDLAESQNTKIIIIGSGKNGLPVILNTGK